ncbi:MAG TPA: DinB family protein [Bryobacteraceae bacterium]|nr:DinB family protein [Bryobacteraceae bacterium]
MIRTVLVLAIGISLPLFAQNVPPGLGQGWMPEFDDAAQQLVSLAEATPAEQFGWRPRAGVRSVSEVYMHLAIANYYLMGQAGAKIPADIAAKLKPDTEKGVTAKADVIQWLKDSQEFVRSNYANLDKQKKVKFFGKDTTADGILLRILVHENEHMGQSVAYARMIGVVPPWSK